MQVFRFLHLQQFQSIDSIDNHSFKLLFLEAGECVWQLADQKLLINSGDVFLSPPTDCHPVISLKGTAWLVVFDDDVWIVRTLKLGKFHLSLSEQEVWQCLLSGLEKELNAHQTLHSLKAASAILILLLIGVARNIAAQPTPFPSCPETLVAEVFQYIEEHHCEAISLRDVAKAMYKSSSYLTDLMRRQTGKTVLQWIIDRRMTEARRLLIETTQSVERIAALVGYSDVRHFSRQFCKLHGVSPQKWRSNQQLNSKQSQNKTP